jgi:uncharacterized protein
MAHGSIDFTNGSLSPQQLVAIFSAIPADLTFIDAEGVVRYFSEYRIFDRPASCLDRDVMDCHKPETRPGISQMLAELRDGWRDEALFTSHSKEGRLVTERYVAVRDGDGGYLGCLEIVQWADEVGAS